MQVFMSDEVTMICCWQDAAAARLQEAQRSLEAVQAKAAAAAAAAEAQSQACKVSTAFQYVPAIYLGWPSRRQVLGPAMPDEPCCNKTIICYMLCRNRNMWNSRQPRLHARWSQQRRLWRLPKCRLQHWRRWQPAVAEQTANQYWMHCSAAGRSDLFSIGLTCLQAPPGGTA